MELWIKFAGIFFGVMARTYLPYLRKLRQGQIQGFDKKYVISGLAALIIGLITTIIAFPHFQITPEGMDLEATMKLFGIAFGFGYGFNSIISEGVKWRGWQT